MYVYIASGFRLPIEPCYGGESEEEEEGDHVFLESATRHVVQVLLLSEEGDLISYQSSRW